VTKSKPEKTLIRVKKKQSGRNNQGRITTRHRGGERLRQLRKVDFKQDKRDIEGTIQAIEYDPNRTALLALVAYIDGEKRYIIASKALKVGTILTSGREAPILAGNCLPMSNIPVGSTIHCIELRPGKGGQIARSAGAYAQLLAREGAYVTVRLRSGEMRKILAECRATIGTVGNEEHSLRVLGKAGAKRWRGFRPTVRGVAMNPVDHPLGGGEGRTSGGRPPCNANGLSEGTKTRKKKKLSNKLIVRRRRNKKGERG